MKDERVKLIASNLRAERNRKGYTQAILAEKANLSVHSISLIERNIQTPSLISAFDISKALQIDINELLKGM